MANRKKKKVNNTAKASSKQPNQKSIDKKAGLPTGGIVNNSILKHSQLKVIMEIPQSYVWALSIFVSLVAIVAPLGQTPYGYNPDLYMASMLQVGALAFLTVYLFLVYKNRSGGILIPACPVAVISCNGFLFVDSFVSILGA